MVMENGFDVGSFISETWDDLKSPTTSDFTSKIQQVKRMIHGSEQVGVCLLADFALLF